MGIAGSPLSRGNCQLAVTDIEMPRLNGLNRPSAFQVGIKGHCSSLLVIAVSSGEDDRARWVPLPV